MSFWVMSFLIFVWIAIIFYYIYWVILFICKCRFFFTFLLNLLYWIVFFMWTIVQGVWTCLNDLFNFWLILIYGIKSVLYNRKFLEPVVRSKKGSLWVMILMIYMVLNYVAYNWIEYKSFDLYFSCAGDYQFEELWV